MSRAVIVPFHKYTPFGREFYMPLFNTFVKNLKIWESEFDRLYIIDSDYNFTEEEKKKVLDLVPNTVFLKRELDGHHWIQYKWIIPKVIESDMLFIDNDVVITEKGVVKNWFSQIKKGYDFVGSFDGSGQHKDEIWEKYPLMKKMDAVRMGSYYFILTKKLLEKIGDYTFDPLPEEGFDSFGKFTLQMLDTNPKIYEIEDDRSDVTFHPLKTNLGYYHVRAGSRIPYLLASKKYAHENDYWDNLKTQPHSEIRRQAEWYQYMGGDIEELLKDLDNV